MSGVQGSAAGKRPGPSYPRGLRQVIDLFLLPLLGAIPTSPRVRWTPLLLASCALLMVWDPSPALIDRFANSRRCLRELFPRSRCPGKTFRGFVKALHRQRLEEQLANHLRQQLRTCAGKHWLREGYCAFAVDGSKIDCPRTRANQRAFGRGGRQHSGPQQYLTCLWHMGTGLPWAWCAGRANASERTHLKRLLRWLPERSLLVADAGFCGYRLLRKLEGSGHAFLLRVGGNITLLRKLGYARRERADTVYLWPSKWRRYRPLGLRLIVLEDRGRRVYLLTNLLKKGELSQEKASRLYRMRWGVEVFYRALKQTLERRKLASHHPRQARVELAWSVLGLGFLGLASVKGIVEQGHDPLSWSVALSLRQVRRQMQRPGRIDLLGRLGQARKDRYQRTGSKKARRWPHKKKDPPIQPPIQRRASGTEVRRAQELLEQRPAA